MMLLRLFLLLNVVMHDGVSMEFQLPADINTWCPYTNFCTQDGNDTYTRNIGNNRGLNEVPCCTSCSCSKDCGRSRNCCRYEDDMYRLDETLNTLCKALSIHENPFHTDVMLPYFHIVHKCPNRIEVCYSELTASEDFFPVYSNDTRMIYYNERCATCHGQDFLLKFSKILTCSSSETSYFSLASTGSSQLQRHGCIPQFIPPEDIDLATERCYPQKTSTCDPRRNASQAFVNHCGSFNATFRLKGGLMFNNVYCLLCNTGHIIVPTTWRKFYEFCPADSQMRFDEPTHFSSILKGSFHKMLTTAETLPMLCNKTRKGDCRPVHCPEGQYYTTEGRCTHMTRRWYFKQLRINVHLSTPRGYNKVRTAEVLSMADPETKINLKLDRPGFEDWKLSLYYNLDESNTTIRYFVAMLAYKYNTVVPEELLNEIDKSMNGLWTLILNNMEYKLKPRLNKHSIYAIIYPDNYILYEPEWYKYWDFHVLEKGKPSLKAFLIYYLVGDPLTYRILSESVFITKPYFCKLIELHEHEYETSRKALYLVGQDKFIYDGEFVWVDTESGVPKARVCLEDIELREEHSRASIAFVRYVVCLVYSTLFVYMQTIP